MGVFNSILKKKRESTLSNIDPCRLNSFGEPLDKLVDGDLPFGWYYCYEDFISIVDKDFNHHREHWVEARKSGNPKAEYDALKTFLQYMDSLQKLCDKKGECFSFWCSEICIGSSWKKRLKEDLVYFEANIDRLQKIYNLLHDKKSFDKMLINTIYQHEGILQKDFYGLFLNEPEVKDTIQNRLLCMDRNGLITRACLKITRLWSFYPNQN